MPSHNTTSPPLPPSTTSRSRLAPAQSAHARSVFRNTLNGEDAWTRHIRYVRQYVKVYERHGDRTKEGELTSRGKTDWDVLRESHRFLREEGENADTMPYDQAVAAKYYASLFKEFAVADLKHYKSGNVALRWRTEEEVLAGIGQFTCGNVRCDHHRPLHPGYSVYQDDGTEEVETPRLDPSVRLTAYEMKFGYMEAADDRDDVRDGAAQAGADGGSGEEKVEAVGTSAATALTGPNTTTATSLPVGHQLTPRMVRKNALVKVVLCERCGYKLGYKREKEKNEAVEALLREEREKVAEGHSGKKKKRHREGGAERRTGDEESVDIVVTVDMSTGIGTTKVTTVVARIDIGTETAVMTTNGTGRGSDHRALLEIDIVMGGEVSLSIPRKANRTHKAIRTVRGLGGEDERRTRQSRLRSRSLSRSPVSETGTWPVVVRAPALQSRC